MRRRHLFISHSWKQDDWYEKPVNLLRQRDYFEFNDYSVPRDRPILDARTDAELREAIRNKMARSSVVLILASVSATTSKWINVEINLAKRGFREPKPIIAVQPRGSEKTSVPAKDAADRVVLWNTESMIDAIRELT